MELFELQHGGIYLRGILNGPRESDYLVVCLAGFEGVASTAKRFRILSVGLENAGVKTLCLDYAGCGLSDGNFGEGTVKGLSEQVSFVLSYLSGHAKVSMVAHSLGACVALSLLNVQLVPGLHRLLFFAPALNQAGLLRYWFVSKEVRVCWDNYELDEQAFRDYCERTKETKHNRMSPAYYLENADRDYHSLLNRDLRRRLMVVQGENDVVVPGRSLRIKGSLMHFVPDGDHNLEAPSMVDHWLRPTLEHLL